MSKRPAATTIGRTSPRQTRREYRVSAPPGGLGRVGSGGHCVTTPEEGALSRGGYGDRYAPFIRAATHAKGIRVTHGTRYRTVGIRGTSHIGACVVVVSVWCTDDIVGQPRLANCPPCLHGSDDNQSSSDRYLRRQRVTARPINGSSEAIR